MENHRELDDFDGAYYDGICSAFIGSEKAGVETYASGINHVVFALREGYRRGELSNKKGKARKLFLLH